MARNRSPRPQSRTRSPAAQPRWKAWLRHPAGRAAAVVAAAFGLGLLLFLLVWQTGRDGDLYRAEPVVVAPGPADLDPLPQPQTDGDPASDMPEAGEVPDDAPPQVVETPPPAAAPPAPAEPAPPAAAAADADGANGVILAPGDRPVPIEGRNPAPRYPPAALRAGQSGTVVLRVEVDAQGRPAGVAVLERSGSRDLDRAAQEAIRRWRFHPAQRDGRAVAASLVVPVSFDLGDR